LNSIAGYILFLGLRRIGVSEATQCTVAGTLPADGIYIEQVAVVDDESGLIGCARFKDSNGSRRARTRSSEYVKRTLLFAVTTNNKATHSIQTRC
jgi:hypothetical protein